MLTPELLKNVEGLTEAQVSAIIKMSENDENTVISKKTREIYDTVDSIISEVTGLSKGQTEKTTELIKRAVGEVKTGLEKKNEELLQQIKEGKGDEQLTKAHKDLQDKYSKLETLHSTKIDEMTRKLNEADSKYADTLVGFEFQKALTDIKLNSDLPESVRSTMVEAAIGKLKGSYKTELSDGKLVFRNAEGELVTNPKNNLNPFTAKELLTDQLKDILAPDATPGGGTGPTNKKADHSFNIKAYKTQVEAMQGIEKSLSAKGFTFGTEAYQAELDKIWAESGAMGLPTR